MASLANTGRKLQGGKFLYLSDKVVDEYAG